ncbi:MAG: putative quinol monooxygenase [Pseudomonadales bacterium]
MTKIILEGHIEVPEGELEAVLAELPNHVALTLGEPGCIEFQVNERPNEPGVFDVYERFESQSAFDAHQLRVRDSRWGAVTANVSRHYQIRTV